MDVYGTCNVLLYLDYSEMEKKERQEIFFDNLKATIFVVLL